MGSQGRSLQYFGAKHVYDISEALQQVGRKIQSPHLFPVRMSLDYQPLVKLQSLYLMVLRLQP